MRAATVAKQTGKQKQPQPETTTVRVHLDDGQDISELASLEGRSAADVYREYCAAMIREKLTARLKKRLDDLKK